MNISPNDATNEVEQFQGNSTFKQLLAILIQIGSSIQCFWITEDEINDYKLNNFVQQIRGIGKKSSKIRLKLS